MSPNLERAQRKPELIVTDRRIEYVQRVIELTNDEIAKLPHNANVLHIGGGIKFRFEQGLKSLRPDVKTTTIDPSMGLPSDQFVISPKLNNYGEVIRANYIRRRGETTGKEIHLAEDTVKIRNQRLEAAKKVGGVIAAKAQELPIANNTFDLIVDTWGPGLYLDRNTNDKTGESDLESYLKNIARILRANGTARIYPIDWIKDFDFGKDYRNDRARDFFENILSNIPGIEYKFIKHQDPGFDAENEEGVRLGVIITKKPKDTIQTLV